MKTLILVMIAVLFAADASVFAKGAKKFRPERIRTRKVDTKYEERADKNKDGKVSRQENQAARKKYLKNRSEVDKKWEKNADKNSDGKIDGKEFRQARKKQETRSYLKNRSEVDRKWEKKADNNKDGKVDAKELKKARKAYKVRKKK